MTRVVRYALLLCLSAAFAVPQMPSKEDRSVRRPFPGSKNQVDEMLKADHAKSLEEAGEILKLAEELKIELEQNDRHILSVSAIKKTEEIEKLAKRIRSRMKR